MDYLNDHNIKRVWAYLDGELTAKAKQTFEQELKDNRALSQSFETQKALHQSLYNLELEKAPDTLADAVMTQIAPQSLSIKATSFKNIKYLGLGFVILNLTLLVVAIGDIQNGIKVGHTLKQYTTISDHISEITSLLSSVEWSLSHNFILGAALLMMMYFVDQIICIKRLKKAIA